MLRAFSLEKTDAGKDWGPEEKGMTEDERELDHKERWVLKNWHFWTVVLEKTLESLLDSKEIQPVHPKVN